METVNLCSKTDSMTEKGGGIPILLTDLLNVVQKRLIEISIQDAKTDVLFATIKENYINCVFPFLLLEIEGGQGGVDCAINVFTTDTNSAETVSEGSFYCTKLEGNIKNKLNFISEKYEVISTKSPFFSKLPYLARTTQFHITKFHAFIPNVPGGDNLHISFEEKEKPIPETPKRRPRKVA